MPQHDVFTAQADESDISEDENGGDECTPPNEGTSAEVSIDIDQGSHEEGNVKVRIWFYVRFSARVLYHGTRGCLNPLFHS